ncbi:hypothetical protein TCDM_04791 [Trypanosoma cruzi Dm28c]|uniref:Uncharacterized protein n=1 Tax=Trypanosoma cruzi Dm28c TaxID=1416333 RepID=V5BKB9_TRYCR|nr:hypothetical protein TCDM_04791 [Trypanosoma cruzi Dm28c]
MQRVGRHDFFFLLVFTFSPIFFFLAFAVWCSHRTPMPAESLTTNHSCLRRRAAGGSWKEEDTHTHTQKKKKET